MNNGIKYTLNKKIEVETLKEMEAPFQPRVLKQAEIELLLSLLIETATSVDADPDKPASAPLH